MSLRNITIYQLKWPKYRTLIPPNASNGCGATGTLIYCWWECKMIQVLWNTVWQFFTKLNVLLYNLVIVFLYIYSIDHSVIKLEINNRKIAGDLPNTWRLNNTLYHVEQKRNLKRKFWIFKNKLKLKYSLSTFVGFNKSKA